VILWDGGEGNETCFVANTGVASIVVQFIVNISLLVYSSTVVMPLFALAKTLVGTEPIR
jgi:hypothetical protein